MRVNTGIRPPGTEYVYVVVEELAKRSLKLTLNCAQIRLNLPSVKICAVVGNSQLEVAHAIGYSM